jgi:hypothetical protein
LRDEIVDREVAVDRPGVFALGVNGGLPFTFVGRSDTDINSQLHVYVGSYRFFSYMYCGSDVDAFEEECRAYHNFEPTDNPAHPTRPHGSSMRCPRCGLLG